MNQADYLGFLTVGTGFFLLKLLPYYFRQFDRLDFNACLYRPHPNECSGGDLDGDLYFVCWDENLIPSKTDTPMDYIARKPRLMDHEVTLEVC